MILPYLKKISSLILLFLFGPITIKAQTTDFSSHMELSIDRYIINHRFGLHALKIHVEMDGMPIPIEDKMVNEIKDFLANYPNQEDYWEIVNKKLVNFLYKIYPTQKKIQTILSIEPDSNKPLAEKAFANLIMEK